ncbi:hypothetical protein K450DRAFT_218513 [Umbelopsis ramanniana AG]|uniref:Cyclin N-terminal domain-containing protein n=1 Tax=Umbelopsis ramanniana AG TaxID=1314678 RepID=A0AAD5EIX7_UMBRA|nr:uncharacterized protein K450DRAFT_218513 [Umbelopsis ramanniana AG]KAI8584172.1 hypothetical protein K450DRAFT_218513 [Umbelopsis ramanniana AG]
MPTTTTTSSNNFEWADFASSVLLMIWYGVSYNEAQQQESFRQFSRNLLSTMQVSSSVVILSLKYVSLLRQGHAQTGAAGSEYRLLVASLMLASKFLDDSTYASRTWAQVSRIPLDDLNKSETEFLIAIGYSLHVPELQYLEWLKYLEELIRQPQLVMHAKRSRTTMEGHMKRRRVSSNNVTSFQPYHHTPSYSSIEMVAPTAVYTLPQFDPMMLMPFISNFGLATKMRHIPHAGHVRV